MGTGRNVWYTIFDRSGKMKEGIRFLHASNGHEEEVSDQRKGLKQPLLEETFEGRRIKLTDISQIKVKNMDLNDAIIGRRSVRTYADECLSLDELAYACYMTQGIKELKTKNTFRTVPSAGARHAFETLLLVNNISGLKPGLYRYLATTHELGIVSQDPLLSEQILEASYGQKMVVDAAVTFIWYAVSYRMSYRYQTRGYRYMFLDAGHVMQNLYLIAKSIDAGTCAIAAYDDDKMNKSVGLDGEDRFVIYMAPLGKLKKE